MTDLSGDAPVTTTGLSGKIDGMIFGSRAHMSQQRDRRSWQTAKRFPASDLARREQLGLDLLCLQVGQFP
jgi:hypothetical protein